MDVLGTVLAWIVGIVLFFVFVAIPLVFIICGISILSVVIIAGPFLAAALIITLVVVNKRKKKKAALAAKAAQAEAVDELQRLKIMMDTGIITEEEFEQKKAPLLERL